MFGKLTWDAIPLDEPIPLITSLVVILAVLGIAIWVWRKGWGPSLWHGYITSTDHKKIGIMYIVLGTADAGPRVRGRDHDADLSSRWRSARRRAICRPSITTRYSRLTARS